MGAANKALKVNSGGTDVDFGTLPVAGGGTGAATLTGIVKASGTSAFTAVAAPTGAILGDSDVQNISGAKTFANQTFALRNPANTFTGTIQNPVFTAAVNVEPFHQFYTYTIYISGSNIKARNNFTGAVEYTNTEAITTVNSAIQNLKNIETSISGGGLFFKKGQYNLTDTINLDRTDSNVNINNFSMAGEGFSTVLNFNPAGALTSAINVKMHRCTIKDMKIQAAVNNITNLITINGDGKYGIIDHVDLQGHSSIPSNSVGVNNLGTAGTYYWKITNCQFNQLDKCIKLIWVSGAGANAQFITNNVFENFNLGVHCQTATNWIAGNFGQMSASVGDTLIELIDSHAFNNHIFGNAVDTGSKSGATTVKLDSGAINNVVIGTVNTGTGSKIIDNSGAKNYLNPTSLTTAHADATVGSSPYTYTNTDGYIQNATVMGGVVSDISVSRSGTSKTFFTDTDKSVTLFGGDSLIVTYAVTPTVRIFPLG